MSGKLYKTLTSNWLAIDTETTGLQFWDTDFPAMPFIITCTDYTNTTYAYEFPVDPHTRIPDYSDPYDPDRTLKHFFSLITQYDRIVFHNSKFDLKAFHNLAKHHPPTPTTNYARSIYSALMEFLFSGNVHDTLPLSHVVSSGQSHGLKDLSVQWLDEHVDDEEILLNQCREARREARRLEIPCGPSVKSDYFMPRYIYNSDAALTYACRDTERTAKLWLVLLYGCYAQCHLEHYLNEQALLAPLYRMEITGLRLDKPAALDLQNYLNEHNFNLLTDLQSIADEYGYHDYNPNSSQQTAAILYEELCLTCRTFTKTGNPSTDKDALNNLHTMLSSMDITPDTVYDTAYQFITALLNYKKNQTQLNYIKSYFDIGEHDGKTVTLRSNWNANGTATTRFSSSNPNLQNINKHLADNPDPDAVPLRSIFAPPPNHTWYAIDYDQLEARLFAHASQDETLLHCFATGGDMHQITADALGIPRSGQVASGKHVNFAWLYGAQPAKLASMANMSDPETFSELMADTYPDAVSYQDSVIYQARIQGRVLTLFGYPLDCSRNKAYIAVNYIIQGSAGNVAKRALILIDHYLNAYNLYPYVTILAQVHDEYIIQIDNDCPYDQTEIIETIAFYMSHAGQEIDCTLPVNVELCDGNWGNTTPLYQLAADHKGSNRKYNVYDYSPAS